MEPRDDGPEGPICLRRVEAIAPSFLGPVVAIPRPRTIERRSRSPFRSIGARVYSNRDRAGSLSPI